MRDKETLLKEHIMKSINDPLQGLTAWVMSGDFHATEGILASLLDRVRKHLGHHLISKEERDGIVTEKWEIGGNE